MKEQQERTKAPDASHVSKARDVGIKQEIQDDALSPVEKVQHPMRRAGLLEKIVTRLRSPLKALPDCAPLTTMRESIAYGYDALGHRKRAEALILGVQYTVHSVVLGDIAEFGTHTGRTAKTIAAAIKLFRAPKRLHLFDSFEGLPLTTNPVDQESDHVKLGVWGPGQLKGLSPSQLRKACAKFIANSQIAIYPGWFSESLLALPNETRFAMVHFDCDLYQSSLDALQFVFQHKHISHGAVLFFDDWDCQHSSNNHGQRRAWREVVEQFNINWEDMGPYGWSHRRIIVHYYE